MLVGIRELKAKLSEYIERVENGEIIVVTRRGRGVAEIVPMPGRGNIERGLKEGWLTRKEDRPPSPVVPYKPKPGSPSSMEILREDRDYR
ncbi:MAG: type II toxin-antitoxin system Phd/YefM family antitoxin [Acidimicrobiia bacterium]